jgi:hypothetical protein
LGSFRPREAVLDECRLDGAHAHLERAELPAASSAYDLGGVMLLQALVWYSKFRPEEARSEILHATDVFEKLGAAENIETCRLFLQLTQMAAD